MSDATDTLANLLYTAAVVTTPRYLGFSSDGSAEIAPTGYARKAVTFSASPSAGDGANTSAVTFDAWTGAGGTLTHAALFDAASGGNRLTAWKALSGGTLTWASGVAVVMPIGTITLDVD